MLRFKVLVSAVPLIAAAILTRLELLPSSSAPCIAVGDQAVEMTAAPWHADLHVSFTDDPKLATVRVGVTDDAGPALFPVGDVAKRGEGAPCAAGSTPQLVAINDLTSEPVPPIIYLSREDEP